MDSTLRAELAVLLSRPLGPEALLKELAKLIVPRLADWCLVHVMEDTGEIRKICCSRADPSTPEPGRIEPGPASAIHRTLHGGPAELHEAIDGELLAPISSSREHLESLRTLSLGAAMVLPLRGRERIHACVTVAHAASGRRYTEKDLSCALDLCSRVALTLDNAVLSRSELRARSEVERITDQTRRLQLVTGKLSRSLSTDEIARILVEEGAAALESSGAAIWCVARDGRFLELLRAVGYPETAMERFQYVPLEEPSPAADAVRTGKSVWLQSRDELIRRYPEAAELLRGMGLLLQELSVADVPLIAEGRVFGVLVCAFPRSNAFDPAFQTFVQVLADHGAQALDRARLLDHERTIRTELLEANQTLEALVAASPMPIVLMDLDGTVRLWNPAAERTFGWSADEVLGHRPPTVPADRWSEVEWGMAAISRGDSIVGLETRGLRRSGDTIEIEVWAAPVRRPDGSLQCLCLLQDITERKRAEEAVRMANRRKDEFLAILGHELRNPLSPILTALQLMRLRGDRSSEAELCVIDRQAKHLVRLVDDLLDVSRITRGRIDLKKERLELTGVIGQAVEMASPLLEEREHRLTVDVPRRGLLVNADPVRLAQVFENLLTNAAKYTPPRGNVSVRAHRAASEVVVSVEDDGRGIEPDVLSRIFDLFVRGDQTLDRSEGGLGLGLPLARSLTQLHGGELTAHSEGPGKGSRFVVRLPAAVSKPAPAPERGAPSLEARAAPAPARRRVLLVDDNPDAAWTLQAMLERYGYDVVVAHDGPSALELFQGQSGRFDVALLDIGLPAMDGYELARRLNRARRERPLLLVAVTGYGQEHDIARSRQAGFAHHLVKPIDLQELLRILSSR